MPCTQGMKLLTQAKYLQETNAEIYNSEKVVGRIANGRSRLPQQDIFSQCPTVRNRTQNPNNSTSITPPPRRNNFDSFSKCPERAAHVHHSHEAAERDRTPPQNKQPAISPLQNDGSPGTTTGVPHSSGLETQNQTRDSQQNRGNITLTQQTTNNRTLVSAASTLTTTGNM